MQISNIQEVMPFRGVSPILCFVYIYSISFFFSIGIFLFFYRISLFSIHLGHICGYIFFSNRCRSRKILWKQSSFYNCTKYRFHTVHVYRFPDENGSTSFERFVQRTLFFTTLVFNPTDFVRESNILLIHSLHRI